MFPGSPEYLLIRDMIFPAQLTAREQVVASIVVHDGGSGYAIVYGAVAVEIVDGGMDYEIGDTITLAGGTFTTPVVLTVTDVDEFAGDVFVAGISTAGNYTVTPTNPVAQASTSGIGTGATFNLTFVIVGDTITLTGGVFSTPTVVTVATLSGSAVATVTLSVPGAYSTLPSNPVSQDTTSGSGVGATFDLTFDPIYRYSWGEQVCYQDGTLTTANVPRNGTAYVSFAVEINNTSVDVSALPFVWLKLRGGPGGILVYEFVSPPGDAIPSDSISASTVTVCCDLNLGCPTDPCSLEININDYTNITVNKPVYINGRGPVTINTPFVICGFQFWCCLSYTPGSATISTWIPPSAATIYTWLTGGGDVQLNTIVPYAGPDLIQVEGSGVNSATTITQAFVKKIQSGDQIIAKAAGQTTTDVTGGSASITMNDDVGNTYTKDILHWDATSHLWTGIWRCSNPSSPTPPKVTLAYTGVAGKIELVVEEVYGLTTSPLDGTSGSSTTGLIAVPGDIMKAQYYEYLTAIGISDDPSNPGTVITSGGFTGNYTDLDGVNKLVTGSAYSVQGGTDGNPSFTFDSGNHVCSVQGAYKAQILSQLIGIVNEGTGNIKIPYGGTSTQGIGILQPGSFTANIKSSERYLLLFPGDVAFFWYDDCSSNKWILLFTTAIPNWTLLVNISSEITPNTVGTVAVFADVGGTLTATGITISARNPSFGYSVGSGTGGDYVPATWEPSGRVWELTLGGLDVQSNAGHISSEPILDFEDNTATGGVTFTVTPDATNHRNKVKGVVKLTSGISSSTIGAGTPYNPTNSYAQVSGSSMSINPGLNLISITVRSDFGGAGLDDVFSYTLYDGTTDFGPVVQASNPDSSLLLNPLETNDVTFLYQAAGAGGVQLRGKTNGSGGTMLILGGYVITF